MGLENQIKIITEKNELPNVDPASEVSREFTRTSFLSLERAYRACDKAARKFARKKSYDIIYKDSQGFLGDYTAIAEYKFYLLKEASLAMAG